MTREELEPINLEPRTPLMRLQFAVADAQERAYAHPIDMADAVIRLVVEACSARVRSVLGPPSGAVVGMDLEATFLPTEKPDAN